MQTSKVYFGLKAPCTHLLKGCGREGILIWRNVARVSLLNVLYKKKTEKYTDFSFKPDYKDPIKFEMLYKTEHCFFQLSSCKPLALNFIIKQMQNEMNLKSNYLENCTQVWGISY